MRKLMIYKNYLATPFLIAVLIGSPVHAETGYATSSMVSVVGVTSSKSDGAENPTKRHAKCADDFAGSHWCDTREYLNGGVSSEVDGKLPTAWIRPSIIAASKVLDQEVTYTDTSGLQVFASQLNCLQWSSKDSRDAGLALQTTENKKKQIVIANKCSADMRNLCCANR